MSRDYRFDPAGTSTFDVDPTPFWDRELDTTIDDEEIMLLEQGYLFILDEEKMWKDIIASEPVAPEVEL